MHQIKVILSKIHYKEEPSPELGFCPLSILWKGLALTRVIFIKLSHFLFSLEIRVGQESFGNVKEQFKNLLWMGKLVL